MDITGWIVIGIAIFFSPLVIRFIRASGPTTGKAAYDNFINSLPEGFNNYAHFYAWTGYALNLDKGLILLKPENDQKIYDRSNVRKVELTIAEASEWTTDGPLLDKLDVAVRNCEEKKKAREQSGVFVKVKDVDHPVWQIKFYDDDSVRKHFEILSQFVEGCLNKQGNG